MGSFVNTLIIALFDHGLICRDWYDRYDFPIITADIKLLLAYTFVRLELI